MSEPAVRTRRLVAPLAAIALGLAVVVVGLTQLAARPAPPSQEAAATVTQVRVPGPLASAPLASAPASPTGPASAAPAPGPSVSAEAAVPAPAEPVRVVVGRLAVDAPVHPIGVDEANVLQVPDATDEVGWWQGGHRPGEGGPAVLVGHVDSRSGPAVFYPLRQAVAGDVVQVEDAAGAVRTFEVTGIEQVAKGEFPTMRVYGPTAGAASEIRLVTCGGEFDRGTGHYVDNVIVYATAVDPA